MEAIAMQLNVLEAKSQLSRLLAAAEQGEEVVIARNGHPVVRLVPIAQEAGLKGFGCLKGSMGNTDQAFSSETEVEVAKLFGRSR
jgi:prevent-host-death family protein